MKVSSLVMTGSGETIGLGFSPWLSQGDDSGVDPKVGSGVAVSIEVSVG